MHFGYILENCYVSMNFSLTSPFPSLPPKIVQLLPLLVSYFQGFEKQFPAGRTSPSPLDKFVPTPANAIFSPYLAYFSYFQFCQLIGQETMRRHIPNIELIERIAYEQLSMSDQESTLTSTSGIQGDDEEEGDRSFEDDGTRKGVVPRKIPTTPTKLPASFDSEHSTASPASDATQQSPQAPKLPGSKVTFPGGNNQFWKAKVQTTHEDHSNWIKYFALQTSDSLFLPLFSARVTTLPFLSP